MAEVVHVVNLSKHEKLEVTKSVVVYKATSNFQTGKASRLLFMSTMYGSTAHSTKMQDEMGVKDLKRSHY